jgi:magnesium-transporting ATPase (P-type)
MKNNSLSRAEALGALVSSENGLSEAEAAKRLSENGFNEIRESARPPLSLRFLRQFTHFLAVLLWIGAGLKDHSPSPGELLESPNIVFGGTTVTSGSGKALVFATGMRTEFGRIAHLTGAVEPTLSPLQKELQKATRLVATIAALVGLFFFGLGFFIGRNFWDNFIFTIGIPALFG